MVNIQPEVRGSLQIYPQAEGEGYIVAITTNDRG